MIYPFSRLLRMPSLLIILLMILTFSFIAHNAWSNGWRTLAKGIEYRDMNSNFLSPWSHIHVFRINLTQNELRLISADSLNKKNASAEQFASLSQGLIAINGGFFTADFEALGLRISNYKLLNPLKSISWWGVFYTQNEKAYISAVNQFKKNKQINFAIQSGPRLIVKGKSPALKPGYAQRTALGITRDGKLILLITENLAMSTKELATFMKKAPLSCQDALNLDGGSSTQVYAKINDFNLNVRGFSNVSDAVVVFPRP